MALWKTKTPGEEVVRHTYARNRRDAWAWYVEAMLERPLLSPDDAARAADRMMELERHRFGPFDDEVKDA